MSNSIVAIFAIVALLQPIPQIIPRGVGELSTSSVGDCRLESVDWEKPTFAKGVPHAFTRRGDERRSEEHTSELQSLMRISYAVFCLKKKKSQTQETTNRLTKPHMNEKQTQITISKT